MNDKITCALVKHYSIIDHRTSTSVSSVLPSNTYLSCSCKQTVFNNVCRCARNICYYSSVTYDWKWWSTNYVDCRYLGIHTLTLQKIERVTL